jgi:hypothetical protein
MILTEENWSTGRKTSQPQCPFFRHKYHSLLKRGIVTMIRGNECTMHVKNTPIPVWWTSSPSDPSSSLRTLTVIPFGRGPSLLYESSARTCWRCYLLTADRFMGINTSLSSHRGFPDSPVYRQLPLPHVNVWIIARVGNIRRLETTHIIQI